jgi:3'(2'), 5'-bisphosphate nucleotidase
MSDPTLAALLPMVRALTLEAGAEVMRWYALGTEVVTKADGSPVTQADQAAEALITPGLHRLLPGVPVIAEEAAAAGELPELGAGRRFWLVDPVDGTREFISRNGEFTVNIALIEDGRPVLGVVLAPALGDLYAGVVGVGAVHSRPDQGDRPITARAAPVDGVVVVGSRRHGDRAAEDRWLAGRRVLDRRSRGSSLKFCVVAVGEADLYPRFGPTHEWDTAAGHAVLAAAGGRVDLIEGGALGYGKPDFLNPYFVAYGRV